MYCICFYLSLFNHSSRPLVSLNSLASSTHPQPQVRTHPETMVVEIKADSIGFGMALEGGSSEYGDYPIMISSIKPGSPAGK